MFASLVFLDCLSPALFTYLRTQVCVKSDRCFICTIDAQPALCKDCIGHYYHSLVLFTVAGHYAHHYSSDSAVSFLSNKNETKNERQVSPKAVSNRKFIFVCWLHIFSPSTSLGGRMKQSFGSVKPKGGRTLGEFEVNLCSEEEIIGEEFCYLRECMNKACILQLQANDNLVGSKWPLFYGFPN